MLGLMPNRLRSGSAHAPGPLRGTRPRAPAPALAREKPYPGPYLLGKDSARLRRRSATPREAEFCRELGPDVRHLISFLGVGRRVPRVDLAERHHQYGGGGKATEPFAVGRHDVPGCPLRAGLAQHVVESPLVVVPVAPLRTSLEENFQFFSVWSMRLRNRLACFRFDRFSRILTTRMPLLTK